MRIGVPTEIKNNEYRVGMTPSGAADLTANGHEVLIQKGAGNGSGFADDEYTAVGARILPDADAVYDAADMIVKVKEPIEADLARLKDGQLLFTYLHLAPVPDLTASLMKKKITGVAYETITDERRRTLPLLTPMSEVAGRMSVHVGAYYLHKPNNGRGVLLGGVPGVLPADVAIIGGGVVGTNAAKMAVGLGARVTILDNNLDRLRQLDDIFRGTIQTLASNAAHIAEAVRRSDLLIGGVLIPGAAAPKLVTRDMIRDMKKGAVIVDVAIDQGGCVETAHPTTHSDPVYEVDGVVHYCVANMPGAVPRTSTIALTNATLPYTRLLANLGFEKAVRQNPGLAEGVNVYKGEITYEAVATSQERKYTELSKLL
ncbi:MAG: alanine dehydrogenase [Acidobacteria bacterium]|nr:alanine dehydrogenase [Acidobacteriota bacterium]MBV9477156.1 alanine dehydrogenase [Acidobacteriota bacterium]